MEKIWMIDDFDLDACIEEIEEILEQEDDLSLSFAEERLNNIRIPKIDIQMMNQLTSLCLYYEDMLNKRPEICDHSLYRNIYNDLRNKRKELKLFKQRYEKNADKILTSKNCLKYVQWFHEQLLKLEEELNLID